MTVQRKKQGAEKHPIMHRIADIRGGVGVKTSELGGEFIAEGTLVGFHSVDGTEDGLYSIIPTARVIGKINAATYKVTKGNCFKLRDKVHGATAYDNTDRPLFGGIQEIDRSHAEYDIIKLDDACDFPVGMMLFEGTKPITPIGLCGTNTPFEADSNAQIDVWVAAVTRDWDLHVWPSLKGIINVGVLVKDLTD